MLFLFSSIFLVGTFQNCAQSQSSSAFVPSTSGSNDSATSETYEKVESIDMSSAEYITVSLQSLYGMTSQQRLSKDFKNLQINLNNGEMRSVDVDGNVVNPIRLCLGRNELEEFKLILQNSRLCQPAVTTAREDIVCSQVFEFPYALLQYSNGNQIKIGEVNGCNRSLDLCEEYKNVYNGFIAYIRNNLEARKCL